ncbi:MAG: translocation/assembly module TamB domain-containing protein [Mucinivorans sp.]
MKKTLKILIATLSAMVVAVIVLPIVLSIVLQIGVVQNFVVDKISEKLSQVAQTRISVGHVAISFFNRAIFDDVLIEDHRRDTMIYVSTIDAGIRGINFLTGKISLGTVTLDSAQVHLYKDSTGLLNVQEVFDHFKPEVPNLDPPNFRLTASELNLLNTTFTMTEHTPPPGKAHAINYRDMAMSGINFQARELSVLNYNVWLSIEHLELNERSGFRVDHLSSARCGVDSSGMYYAAVRLESQGSVMELDSMNFLTANHSWYDWNDFENKMILSARVDHSTVSSRTLSYVAGLDLPHEMQARVSKGRLWGAVCQMQGSLEGAVADSTQVNLDFSISGLPNIDSTLFVLNLNNLLSSGAQVNAILSSVLAEPLSPKVMAIIARTGVVKSKGRFEGLLTDFNSKLNLSCSAGGSVGLALHMQPTKKAGLYALRATVGALNLDVGEILGVKKLGAITFGGSIGARLGAGRRIELETKANIGSLGYGTYTFGDIAIDGHLRASGFDGTIVSHDRNMLFTAVGAIDMSQGAPNYSYDMTVDHADLAMTGLNNRDSISVFSAHLSARAQGWDMDDVNGMATINNILYINHLDTVRTGLITIESVNSPTLKQIKLNSDFADVDLRGRNSFSEIFRYFSRSIERFLPSFPDASKIVAGVVDEETKIEGRKKENERAFADGYYQLKVNVKQANNVAGIFVPGLEIAEGSELNFFFNPYLDQFTLRVTSELIEMPDMLAENVELDSRNHSDSLSMFITSDYIRMAGIGMPDFSIIGGIKNNTITLGGRFTDSVGHSSVLLRTTTTFDRTPSGMAQMRVILHATPMSLHGNQWNMSQATVLLDTTGIEVRNFSLSHLPEKLSINGRIGDSVADTLRVELQRFDISPATALISELGYRISGIVGGHVNLVSTTQAPRFFAELDFNNVALNDYKLGNPKLLSTFDAQHSRINFVLGEDPAAAPVAGYYSLSAKEWGGKIQFPHFDMVLLEPLLAGILTSTSGQANVDLTLRGHGELPNLSGVVEVNNYSAMVDYTKARYNLSGQVIVRDNSFFLAPTPINDGLQGRGTLSAELKTKYFKDLKFDVKASFTDLLALNTTVRDNTSFYGKAYGTGRLAISGDERRTNINIVAATARSSQFVLPLSTASTIENAEFIRFVDRSKPPQTTRVGHGRVKRSSRPANANELDIKIDLRILPNTLAEIEFDAKIGDVIKARGEGDLSMHINPTQNIFTMAGPVEVTQGDYLFTLLTIFQRHFVVNSGARLLWTGDPTNPEINLSAIYKVKTSLEPLQGMLLGQSTTANIDCAIDLTGRLTQPDIRFSITAPSADPETQNLLRNSINTEEALSMQFLSLMLSNSFMPDMGASSIGTMSGSFMGVTGLEFLSNQLSQLMSTDKVSVRLGYRPQTVSSSDEIYAGVGGDLISDVLSFEVDGNYNTGNSPSYNSRNPFTFDAYLTWNINKKRTLKLRGFTRTVDRFDETQGLQESGIGVYFRQDFKDLPDLKTRLRKSFTVDSLEQRRMRLEKAERARARAARARK